MNCYVFHCTNKVLPPKKLFSEYKKYRRKVKESYTIAFTISNFRDIVDVHGYNITIKLANIFSTFIKDNFPDGLVGNLVDGDYILVTNKSITEINNFFNLLIDYLTNCYISGSIPVEIKFRSGISKNDIGDFNEELRRAITAMLYQRSESVYVQYYCENLETEYKKQVDYIDNLDKMIKEKKVKNIEVDILNTSGEKTDFKELRIVDNKSKQIFTKNNIPLIEKYGQFNRIDVYNFEYLFEKAKMNSKNIYMINVNFSIIYKNQYLFLDNLKKLAKKKNILNEHICLNINYDNYTDNKMELIYITREIKNAGFLLCLQRAGLLGKGYTLIVTSSVEVDYVKFDYDVLVKAMNEKRMNIMLNHFVNMYLELGVIPIFTDVATEGQVKFIHSINKKCLIRKKLT